MKTFVLLAVVGVVVAVGIYTKGDIGAVMSGLGDATANFSPVKTVRVPNPLN